MPSPCWVVSLGQALSKLSIVQQNQRMPTNCKTGPVHIQRRIPPLSVRPREERKHVHTTLIRVLAVGSKGTILYLCLGGAVGGGERENFLEWAGPLSWTLEKGRI